MGGRPAGVMIGLLVAGSVLVAAAAMAAPPKADRTAPPANGTLSEADRLAIQSALAWLGDFDGMAGGDFDDKTMAALKAFQQRHSGRSSGVLSDEERTALANAAKRHEDAVGWRIIDDPATGARLGLPSALVPRATLTPAGSRWTSARGTIEIETFRLREAALPALFEDEKKAGRHREIERSVLKRDSFVIAGMRELKKFIVRVQASGSELRGITILYDQATEGVMGPAAIAVANTFQGFPDPNAAPPPGIKRSVEYGTAIVVSGRGHLIATAQLTEQCQAITVPGFGHAERIATDDTNDLALLRLYGAQNLVPAALDRKGNTEDDLMLLGISDPLAQAGDGALSRAPARFTPHGIDPMPKPGFAGAAAIDAQGRFAGMVDFKLNQAALIPVEAVRAFLAAQGLTPVTARSAMDQSVMRVICVRK